MWSRWIGPALLALGVGLVVAALATGEAHFALVLIVPVIYGGSSALLIAGVVSTLLGIFALGLGVAEPMEVRSPKPLRTELGAPPSGAGGLVLVGPFPIFFGNWKNVSRATKYLAALAGAIALAALVLAALWLA